MAAVLGRPRLAGGGTAVSPAGAAPCRARHAAAVDVASLYADALVGLPATIDGQSPLPVPATCPFTLDELLAESQGTIGLAE